MLGAADVRTRMEAPAGALHVQRGAAALQEGSRLRRFTLQTASDLPVAQPGY